MRMMDKSLRTTLPSIIALVDDGGGNGRDGVGVCRGPAVNEARDRFNREDWADWRR